MKQRREDEQRFTEIDRNFLWKTRVSTTKFHWLMAFKETIVVYRENHMKLTNISCAHNEELLTITAGGTHNDHWV
jgi:hypothetical protein